ncbi:MAG: agmatinase [Succinivibrio sp.]
MQTLNHAHDISLVSNAFGFMRTALNFSPYDSDADIVITGVPFDMATSGRSGSRFGPNAIRQISTQLAWEANRYPWDFNVFERLKVEDCGDLVYAFGDNQNMVDTLTAHADRLIASGKKMLTFGGDHFITLPLLRAHAKKYGKMALIHFDAHADTYSNGSAYDHGTMFYHAPKEGLIDPSHSVQIGIRTEFDPKDGFLVLDGCAANDMSIEELSFTIHQRVGDYPCYLSFDIDCLDPAFAPGTGTPVTGGLSSDKVLKILRSLKDLNIAGQDVVEVAPSYDHAEITSLAAATIALEMLYLEGYKRG